MDIDTNWKKKVIAFLHDPIIKMSSIYNHKGLAKDTLEILGIDYPSKLKFDQIAAAITRILLPFELSKGRNLPEQLRVDFEESRFIHPFSGNELIDYFKVKEKIKEINSETLKKFILSIKTNDYKKLAYRLWWFLPKISDYSYLFLEDTRLTNQSIIDHLDISAALANSDDKNKGYVILLVSIGPVQEFISAGRKIRDLRAGSYLLSYLTFKGIEVVGENYGFDAIIFPDLRNNYLIKKYLEKHDEFFKKNDEKILPPEVAALPNIFTAIVPNNSEILNRIEDQIRAKIENEFQKISNYIFNKLIENSLKDYSFLKISENDLREIWNKQVKIFPNILILKQRFYLERGKISQNNSLFRDWEIFYENDELKNYYKKLKTLKNTYDFSEANLYHFHSKLLQIKSFLRKNTRDFKGIVEDLETPGDDISGSLKSIVKYDLSENNEKLSALSLIKREFHRYLKKEGYIEAAERIKSTKPISCEDSKIKECIVQDYKMGILLMDGDQMGKWITGEKIENFTRNYHPKTLEYLKKHSGDYFQIIKDLKLINPVYQKSISRTLNKFSYFVPIVVKEFGGELIYAGGDDVLAIFPSNKVMEAANKIRKIYSGIGKVKLKHYEEGRVVEYEFKNGFCYKDGTPIFNMMGDKASMSAGIVVCNPKFNLSLALEEARKAEKLAKNSGRNRFCLKTIKRSGQIKEIVFKWEYENEIDIVDEISKILNLFNHKEKSAKAFFNRLKFEYETLNVNTQDFLKKVIPYVMKRTKNFKHREKVLEVFKKFKKIDNFSNEELINFIELNLEFEYIKRKVDSYE